MDKTEKKYNKFVFSKLSSDWVKWSEKIKKSINEKIDNDLKDNLTTEEIENFKDGISKYINCFYNEIPDMIRQFYLFTKTTVGCVVFSENDLKTLITFIKKLNNKEIDTLSEIAKLTTLTMNYFDNVSFPIIKEYCIKFAEKHESKLNSFFFNF